MLALFMSGRLRYDVVAAVVLLAAVLLGVVPGAKAFHGFANPVIIIIASVLVVSRAIAASSILELSVGSLLKRVRSPSLQIGVMAAAVGYLSAFVKNVGTLGIFMPIAIQTARRSNMPRSIYLMPLAFASLVGGTITKIGTSPNLLISSVREELGQPPFGLFDFVAVGLPLTTLAIVFLAVGWRLLPQRTGEQTAEESFSIADYATELRVPADATVEMTVGAFEALGDGDVSVAAILREGTRRYVPSEEWRLYPNDVLVVLGDPTAVHKLDRGDQVRDLRLRRELAAPGGKARGDAGRRGHRHRRLDARRPDAGLAGPAPQVRPQPVRRAARRLGAADAAARAPLPGRRRRPVPGLGEEPRGVGDRARPPAARRSPALARPGAERPGADRAARRRAGARRPARDRRRDRVLRRSGADRAAQADQPEGHLPRDRVAGDRDARLPDPGRRGAEGHRRRGARRRPAEPGRPALARLRDDRPDPADLDAADAVPAPRRRGARARARSPLPSPRISAFAPSPF